MPGVFIITYPKGRRPSKIKGQEGHWFNVEIPKPSIREEGQYSIVFSPDPFDPTRNECVIEGGKNVPITLQQEIGERTNTATLRVTPGEENGEIVKGGIRRTISEKEGEIALEGFQDVRIRYERRL